MSGKGGVQTDGSSYTVLILNGILRDVQRITVLAPSINSPKGVSQLEDYGLSNFA